MFYFCSVASEFVLSPCIPSLLSSHQCTSSKKKGSSIEVCDVKYVRVCLVYVYAYVYIYIYHFYNFHSFTKVGQYFL